MIKTFIFVEDGSVDLDELKSSVGDDVLVVPYRQGAAAPEIQQPREPVSRREVNIKDRLLDLMSEFDEMGFVPTTLCLEPEEYANEWREKVRDYVKRIEAENAALRERLEKAVELPFRVIDKLTGKEADIYDIALKEEWASELMYCDMEGFAIEEDGTLILCDECGKLAYAPADRFEIVSENRLAEKDNGKS